MALAPLIAEQFEILAARKVHRKSTANQSCPCADRRVVCLTPIEELRFVWQHRQFDYDSELGSAEDGMRWLPRTGYATGMFRIGPAMLTNAKR